MELNTKRSANLPDRPTPALSDALTLEGTNVDLGKVLNDSIIIGNLHGLN